jgi:ribosome modulation factor
MNPLTIAYELGYHSGVNGEDPRVCPYPKMTLEWKSWNEAQRHGANVRLNAESFARWHEANEQWRLGRGQSPRTGNGT